MISRADVQKYLDEFKDRGEAIAALLEDYPELEKKSILHERPAIEVLLEDLDTYGTQE